jgi:adenosine kinase
LGVVITGSIAFDYIMSFPGLFREHILPDKLDSISLSFLVDSMRRERGGVAPNIAYNLSLLGERPQVMGTVGQDFSDYRVWLEERNVDTSTILTIEDDFTASFFCSTDLENNQIANFYTGAMSKAAMLSFRDRDTGAIDIVVISPNDPGAMVQYVRECRDLDLPYMYDPSQQIIRLSGEALREGIEGATVLIVNEYEFGMIEKKTGIPLDQITGLVETVIITQGEDGSLIFAGDERYEIPVVRPRELAEPTGVGDGYRAGILKGFVYDYPWPIAGRLGSLVAAYVLEQHGTQNHTFTLPEFVQRFREEFGDDDSFEPVLEHILTFAKESN